MTYKQRRTICHNTRYPLKEILELSLRGQLWKCYYALPARADTLQTYIGSLLLSHNPSFHYNITKGSPDFLVDYVLSAFRNVCYRSN